MGSFAAVDLDAHLCAGGTVVAASDRAARAVRAAFNRARRAEGREAWSTPRIYDWQTFVRLAWEELTEDSRLLLNPLQELSLWESIIAGREHPAATLAGPRRSLSTMAMLGHALLCSHAPEFLDSKSRRGWTQDSEAFGDWLSSFDEACRQQGALSSSRLPLELLRDVQLHNGDRPKLLLVGFDRVLPTHKTLLDVWGKWELADSRGKASTVQSFFAADQAEELSACAEWCSQQLKAAPEGRMLIITQDVQKRRGEFERALLHQREIDSAFRFEFTLGVPLAQTAPVRCAHMLLRWLDGELAEHELDWLIASPHAANASESAALQARMRGLRERGLQRTHWKLTTFLDLRLASAPLPDLWAQRIKATLAQLQRVSQREMSPIEWADTVPQLLETMNWPGAHTLTSTEFQVIRRWRQVLDSCGSLGFNGRRMKWQEFLAELLHAAGETLFAPESEEAPILIAGPAESAGLTADAIWFLGAHEDAWPARGEMHPLIPVDVQRRAQMPHSTPQLDWDLAQSITQRLVASAHEVNFSFARQAEGVDLRASKIVTAFAGLACGLPSRLLARDETREMAVPVEDVAAVPHRRASAGVEIPLRGGAALLTAQSVCAFKAFATGRLRAATWEAAERGLTAAERGKLLHDALHSVWAGPPDGIRSSRELQSIADLPGFVRKHVQAAIPGKVPLRIRDDMPPQYLALEAARLTRLISEWLAYEQTRVEFEVVGTEIEKTLNIAGLALDLRLDRLDRLNDRSQLVIDYKTGDVSPKSWESDRPEDVQLPLYAGFGIDQGEGLGGLVFAKVRPGNMCFEGKVGDASAALDRSLKGTSALVKYPLELDQLLEWRETIERLAHDFLSGRADVNPLDLLKSCERCGLQTLCRINERPDLIDDEDVEALDD
ncbi:PD-(D/E)XK nuclease family protein [Occallatibacter riparius]|uniref:PD-(D/E)XK nuclease family protein n=1 Tax=Occallatibacter riparius TaxID=1002689 RepID=A0A9J7BRR9_9BACT|nr:PD-(D/E)XK nuclease family protein [Occallatibacter riparius]UWZ83741.1 PD-(D/E)XK nuclease family protein [Occallatibacter riparius]